MAEENNKAQNPAEPSAGGSQSPQPSAPAPSTQAPQPHGTGPRHGGPGGRPHGGPGGRPAGGHRRGKRNYVRKKKVCRFCTEKADFIDYKKPEILQTFMQERGKILPRRITGTCARHQRWLTVAIKRAQNIALLPFAAGM